MGRAIVPLFLVAALGGNLLAGADYRLADRRASPGEDRRLEKVLVVAIATDREVRHRLEDKFVAHLSGRGVAGRASHVFVPDLTSIAGREEILAALDAEGVDSVLTIRAVQLDEIGEAAWIAAWEREVVEESSVRALIERSLPVPEKAAKRYGVEFAVWDTRAVRRLWSARTDAHTRKQLRSGTSELLQVVIDDLKYSPWF